MSNLVSYTRQTTPVPGISFSYGGNKYYFSREPLLNTLPEAVKAEKEEDFYGTFVRLISLAEIDGNVQESMYTPVWTELCAIEPYMIRLFGDESMTDFTDGCLIVSDTNSYYELLTKITYGPIGKLTVSLTEDSDVLLISHDMLMSDSGEQGSIKMYYRRVDPDELPEPMHTPMGYSKAVIEDLLEDKRSSIPQTD